MQLDYLGFERKNDLVIYYVEIYNPMKLKSFIVENKILFDSFKNQKNIILYSETIIIRKVSFIHMIIFKVSYQFHNYIFIKFIPNI